MGNKLYRIGEAVIKSTLGEAIIRNKALLDDETIVEYDQCCEAGGDPGFGPKTVLSISAVERFMK